MADDRSAESKFRVAGLVAQAAKRFIRSINPPMTFGKQAGSPSGDSPRLTSDSDHNQHKSATTKKKTHQILFSPLMPVDDNK
jgi:hypothetical protein